MSVIQVQKDSRPRVMLITLDRPECRNALSKPLLTALEEALGQAEADTTIGCVVITGAGARAFSAGADIREQTGFSPEQAYEHMRWGQDLFTRLEHLCKPTFAAINGFALGGGLELALACDFRTASDSAQLGFPEVNLASLPGWGGTQRLPKLIGSSRAKQLAMTGQRISAQSALQLGIVSSVHPHDDLLTETLVLAEEIASRSLASLSAIKQVIREALEGTPSAGMEAEARAVERLWGTPDQKRAQEAFFAGGKPAAR